MASNPIYQFHAELCGYKPKIWRRFQVANNVTLARLGYILMSMFEMQASHLFSFEIPFEQQTLRYEILDEDSFDFKLCISEGVSEATQSKVKDVITELKTQAIFNYDFGDDWNVRLELEKIIVDKELPGSLLPRVLEGEGYGIIEDCGGVGGLEDIAAAFKKKKGPDYEEYCDWLGRDDLDLTAFDIDDANLRLKKVPRIYADMYERHIGPTKQSIKFLERVYLGR